MKNDLISVIIPVYNVEQYLRQCVDSVLAQTYKNYEIILVDDGATDSSGSICDEYASKFDFVKVIHKPNGGLSSARNAGMYVASGEYYYFLDSDDWIEIDALEKLITCANSNNADLVFMAAKAIDDNNNVIKGNYDYCKQYTSGDPSTIMSELMKNKEFHTGTPFCFLHRDIFKNNNLLFTEGVLYEDMIMSYQLFSLATRAAHLNEKLYIRRFRANSIITSKKSEKNFQSALKVYKTVIDFSESIPSERVQKKHIIRCAYNAINIYTKLKHDDKINNKIEFKKLKEDILKQNAFGDTSLKMRCYGYIPWFVYKAFSKVFKR